MEPIEGTRRALRTLRTEGIGVEADLRHMAREATRIVPELVGLSLADLRGGLTFTLVATDAEIASLDAVQYLDGGPCVEAAHVADVRVVTPADLVAEDRWLMFARATAAAGIASTLTLPIVDRHGVVGSVNLYAATEDGFEGRHDDLANALGASAVGAVRNADLSFTTRLEAERAPETLAEQDVLNVALGIIAARHRVDMAIAEERLREAAARAGVPVVELARALRDAFEDDDRA
jgi:GAF domain-containing protein